MGKTDHKVILYTAQTDLVAGILERDGVCYSKREYVAKKYQESAIGFLTAYDWFVKESQKYLPCPPKGEFPYWAFMDLYSADQSGNGILKLEVPANEAIYFDMYDWLKVLSLRYIGETPEQEEAFRRKLADHGIKREMDAVTTNFYSDLKQEIQNSWKRLFRYHEQIKAGEPCGAKSVQAALWCLKKNGYCGHKKAPAIHSPGTCNLQKNKVNLKKKMKPTGGTI